MKKQLITLAILTGLTSASAFASDYSGFRVGVGAEQGHQVNKELGGGNLKTSPKLEFGYDFNRIFSVNAAFTGMSGSYSDSSVAGEVKGSTARIEAEVGYAFDLGNNWDIKPYAAFGGAHVSGDASVYDLTPQPELYSASDSQFHGKYRNNYATMAAGVRVNTPVGLYVDARVQSLYMTPNQEVRAIVTENSQAAFSVGYKF